MKLNLQKKHLKQLTTQTQISLANTPHIAGGCGKTRHYCVVTVNECKITDLMCPTFMKDCLTEVQCCYTEIC
jgi:hypothetical protein